MSENSNETVPDGSGLIWPLKVSCPPSHQAGWIRLDRPRPMWERLPVTDPSSYELNRASWDERAPAHAASPDYGFAKYAADPGHLSSTVTFDRVRLGDVHGVR